MAYRPNGDSRAHDQHMRGENRYTIDTLFRACLKCGIFFLFLRFFCEIELIPIKFLCDSCEIPAFQTGPTLDSIAPSSHDTGIHAAAVQLRQGEVEESVSPSK